MAELRKALGSVPDDELKASDERVLDSFVDDKKGAVSAFENDFSRQLDAVQESIESRIEGELQSVQSDFMARMDEAVSSLRQNEVVSPERQAAAASAIGDGLPPAQMPKDGLVVVAGAGTPLGSQLLRDMGAGAEYRLRVLVPEGQTLQALDDDVEQVAYAPFAPTALSRSLADASAVIIVSAAAGGAGGVEMEAVPKLLKAMGPEVRRVVFVSVHGVERTDKLPFNLANMFGQLDKQRAAEQEVVLGARKSLPSFTILRLPKLTAGGAADASAPGVVRTELQPGDALGGEVSVQAAAAVVSSSLMRTEAVNASLSVGPLTAATEGPVMDDASFWDDQWLKLVGPELYRRPLGDLPPGEMIGWLQTWARSFLRPGQQLTTPVAVQDVDDGVKLRFLTRASGYADFDVEESSDGAWADAAKIAEGGEPDGALLLLAEARPTPRVRVTRTEMGEGVVVKEMSEEAVIAKLGRDISALETQRRNGK